MKQLAVGTLFLVLSCRISFLEASQIPPGQDVGATVRIEKTEKEQKAMMKKLSRKPQKVEIKGKEKIQPERKIGSVKSAGLT